MARITHAYPTVDFETEGIQKRPLYPPKPVGVSILMPEQKPQYLAWGHATGNNCTESFARTTLREIWMRAPGMIFHNGKFDVDVAEAHLGLKMPRWDRIHDTLFLLFLDDPHARSLSLKPSAERILGMKADERDELKKWILANVAAARQKPSEWAAYMAEAPGTLVGKYSNGDTLRTERLFRKIHPQIVTAGMQQAYDRERRLMPILLASERAGLRVNVPALQRDVKKYAAALERVDGWIRKHLKAPELNIDSNDELALSFKRAGYTNFSKTAGGNDSVSKVSLLQAIDNPRLLSAIGYHNRMSTCLNTFMLPWIAIGSRNHGRIHTQWHQVRSGHGEDKFKGARTGRAIASEPNLLNLAKSFIDRDDGYVHPKFIADLPELPLVRQYVLPDDGQIFAHRDYNQQELRVLAHFEDGTLLRAYNADPTLDMHEFVRQEIKRVRGVLLERRPVKILNFGMIYGMGLAKLALSLKVEYDQAKEVRNAQRAALPDVVGKQGLEANIKRIGEAGDPIRTWGGRLYYSETPKIIDGHTQRFEYKLLNYLIQGSSADLTKEAVIRYHEHPMKKEGRFLVTVYDEINASMPKEPSALKREMMALRESMESVELDVKLLSDGKIGPSWGALKKFDDKR